jgi:hypothetical protein
MPRMRGGGLLARSQTDMQAPARPSAPAACWAQRQKRAQVERYVAGPVHGARGVIGSLPAVSALGSPVWIGETSRDRWPVHSPQLEHSNGVREVRRRRALGGGRDRIRRAFPHGDALDLATERLVPLTRSQAQQGDRARPCPLSHLHAAGVERRGVIRVGRRSEPASPRSDDIEPPGRLDHAKKPSRWRAGFGSKPRFSPLCG